MNSRFFTTALLLFLLGLFAIPESNAQTNTTQPDTVCVSSLEFYRVDSAAGSRFVWGLKYGGGTILSNPLDSAARISVQWNPTVGFDTLWVVEYNLHGCSGDTNKIRVSRFTVPALTVSGNNFSICEGGVFNVNVNATGIPLLTYQWKHNGVDIPGATSAALSIAGLNATHAGTYTCTVTNPCGLTVTENITLVVKFNPVITLQPIAISTCPGATINLSTANTGTGPFTYVWKKDGVTVSDGGGITGATTANLQIAGMTLANTGNYTCTITNSCATVVTTSVLVNINVPPVITQQPLSVSICEAEPTSFNFIVSGDSLFYQWKFNGVDIPGETGANLIFSPAQYPDTGTYTCYISNTCGNVTTVNAVLNMNIPPVITDEPDSISTCVGQNIALNVTATGDSLFYQWKKEGVDILGATSSTLAFSPVSYADTGNYVVFVYNTCGNVTSVNAHVNINVPPVIISQTGNISSCLGNSATMQVTATGDSLFYQWKRNGINVPGATLPSLTINPVTPGNVGNYVCDIVNTCGSVSSVSLALSVNIVPVITQQPVNKSSCLGNTHTFTVVATGDSLKYQWRRNGVDIAGATLSTYTVSPVTLGNIGTYTCYVYNTCGNQLSNPAELTVNIAPVITVQPQPKSSCLGNSHTFSVTATGDSLNYQWKRNGINIPGAISSTYTVNPITLLNTGAYQVVITNTCGTVSSNSVNLSVNIVPVITQHPVNKSSCLGNSHTFSVVATGDSLKYQWRRNGVDIVGATASTHTVNPVTLGNVGAYTCYVYNTCGNQLSNVANLSVNIAPVISIQPKPKSSCLGLSHTFSVTATGDSLKYQWKHNGVNIAGATSSTYTVNPVSLLNTGTYQVIVSNTCGTVSSNSVLLNVNIAPVITQHPVNKSSCLGFSHTFSVTATGDSLKYQWRRNGVDIAGATASTYTVNPVSLGNVGAYTCYVYNTCGNQLSNAANLTVNIAPVITVQPKHKSSCLGQSHTFSVTATGDSLKYQWKFNGINIPGAVASTYTVNPVSLLNTGPYQVIVSNTCGIVSSNTVNLTVNIAPVITLHPKTISSCIGNSVTLTAAATGDSLKYQWRRDGINVPGATNASLTINPVNLTNTGYYTCVISNTCGTQTTNAGRLTVNVAPVITVQPKKVSTCPGLSTGFTVTATGDSLKYQWYKNSFLMPGKTSPTLTFNPVTYADTADYYLRIYNTCGTINTVTVNLNINIPPTITRHPQSLLTCVGDSTAMTVRSSGDSLFYQWRFNGVNIPGGTNRVLPIDPITLANIGIYDVVVTNSCGQAVSDTAHLYANIDPSVIINPKSISSCIGNTETLRVGIVAGGSALPNFQWYKDGVLIPGATDTLLVVNNITLAKTGAYYCELWNNCDAINTTTAFLTVNIAPVITSQPQNISTCIGNSVAFNMTVTGDSLNFQWYKDGFPLAGATSPNLAFNPVNAGHVGFYYCKVWNTCGTLNSQNVQLYMNTPPGITLQPVNRKACAGDNVILQVAGSGDFLQYQWFKDGVLVPGATNATLQFNPVSFAHRGAYQCRVQNTCGTAWSNIVNVWVNTTPIITTQPQGISTCAGTTLVLNTVAIGDSITYQWKLEGIDIPGANSPTYTINNIQFIQTGNYTCYLSTRCGVAMTQQARVTINRVPVITSQPTDVNACAGDYISIGFGITGDSLFYRWQKDGINIPGANQPTLDFAAINVTDRGIYRCYIWNTCGNVWTNEVNVWVNILPAVVTQPLSATRCEDDSVSFRITPVGDFITLQWYRNNVAITGATTNVYSIPRISMSDAGQYFCRVTSQSCGYSDSQLATLTVVQKFVVSAVTNNITCNGSTNAAIDITITGGALPLTYKWSNGATTQDLTGLSPGTYTVSIRDQNNCKVRKSISVDQPDVLAFVHDTTNWSNALRMGGAGNDKITDIRTDRFGNTYVTGHFQSNANFQTQSLTSFGDDDIFLAKYNAAGNLSWIKQAGGTLKDQGRGLALDTLGNIYLTGTFTQMAFFGTTQVNANGNTDAFLAKYDNNGNFQWVKNYGGFFDDAGNSIFTDEGGYSWVTGSFQGISTFGSTTLISRGGDDIYLAKFDNLGALQWVQQAGGTSEDFGHQVMVDISEHAIITGRFQGTATFGSTNIISSGNNDIFMAKYNTLGNLLWVRKAGGTGNDLGRDVSIDQSQNIYLTGNIEGTASFGATTVTSNGLKDAFTAKYDKNGNPQWVRTMGGTGIDNAKAIYVDVLGNAYTTGSFRNSMVLGDKTLTSAGQSDIFVTKHNTNGYLVWSQQAGGAGADSSMTIFMRNDKNLVLGGSFTASASFAPGTLVSSGGDDAFMVRLNQVAVPTPPVITPVNCFGGTEGGINITVGGGTLPYQYLWSNGANTEDLVNIPEGTYWLFVNDINACQLNTTLQVNYLFPFPEPPTSASVDRNFFCTTDPGNITLTAVGGSGDVLEWYENSCGGTSIASGPVVSIPSPTVTTTYYARWENACGATICASVTVTVVPLPVAPTLITVDQNPICEGTAYIKLAAAGGSGEILKWYSGSCGGVLVGTGTPLTITAPTTPTTYYARWESVCGASACASIDITVTPLPQPVTGATASISTICFNDPNPITLTAVGGSGTTLKWAKGSCTGEIVGIGPIILIDPPTTTTTYYAFWENACGVSACVPVTITVTPAPVMPVSISSSNNLFCAGSVANITLTAVGGSGDLVRWFRGYCGSTDMIGTGTSITIPSPATTTAYYARWENACGVTACAYTTVTVYPMPTVFFTGLNASYCIDNPAVLITGNMQPNGYFGGNGIINNGNGTAWFNPVIAGLGTHTVTYTFTSPQGCTVTSTQNVTVNPLPFVSFVGLATKYCVNSAAVTLTGNMAPAGTFTGPGITGITFNPAVAGVGTHTITYTYSDINGCANSVSKTTTVYPLPIVDFAGLLPQYCVNNPPVVLTGNQGPNGFFSGLGVTNIGPGQAIFDPAVAGVGGPYTVIFQFTDPTTGCTNSKTKTVSVVALPTASFTGLDLEYCLNAPQDTLWGNMAPAGTFSGPGIINNGNGTAFFRPSVAGIGGPHTITYTYTDPNGCFASSQMTTIVRPVPTVNFTGLNTQYCISVSPVLLTGNMAPFGTFSGPGITDNANGTATFDPAAAGTGTHSITYTAANTFGCSNTITKTVTVNPLPVVSFTGLAATYCINSPFAVLTGNKVPFGTFSGPGIQDLGNGKARFYPNLAGIGGPYTITYTYMDGNACQNSVTNTTTVIDLPVVSVSGLEPSYCINAAPDTITGNFAPMGTFTGPGITDLNIGKAIFNPATAGVGGPYTIKYTYSDLNGCTNFITYEVMVTALPVVTFNTLASSYCVNGNPVILVGSHKPFGTFTTTAAAGLTDYGNGTGLFTPSVAGVGGPYSITYEYTDLNGCSASQTQSTSVIPTAVKPDTIQTSANNFCTGTVPNIILTAIGGSGTTVRWFKGSCGGTMLGTGTSITVPSPADTTKYFARWENSCGVSECTMLQINIVHYAIAAAAVSVDQTNFCSGTVDSISLSAVGGFGQTFKWFKNSCGGTLVGSGNPLKIPAPLVTTTYYGRWETGCGASACKPITVTVKPQPVIADSISVNHNNFCQGAFNNIVLTANGGSGQTFEWYTSSCGGNIIGSGTTLILPAPDTTTIYYGRWLNTCDTTDCKTIQVNVFPVTIKPDSISADNNDYCSGTVGIVNLTAFGGLGTTLEWFENTCGGTPIGTGTPLMINAPTATTTFFARWVNPCGASECTSFTLNVIPQPVKPDSLTVDTNYFCQSYNGIIILNGFGGVGDTLKWYTDACNGTYVGKGTELRIPAPDTTTWYFAKWTNICGESTCDSIHVIVNEPMPLDSIYADTTLVCYNYNQPITLTAVGGHGDVIKWFKGSCGSAPIGTGSSIQVSVPPATTTYFARMENYCGTTPCDSVTITVIPKPTKPTLIEADTNFFCPGTVTNITLTAIGGYGDTISGLGETLRWFLGSCGGMEIGTGTSITIPAPVVSTKYYARWENSCGVSACNEIQIVIDIPRPVSAAWVDTNNFCPGAVEDITLMSSGGYGQLLGWYSKDLSGNFNLITYGQPVNLFAPDTTTTYYVRWENNCGVSAWDSVVVIVNIPLIPSLITVDTNGFCSDYNMPITLSAIEGRGDTLRWFTGACDGTEIGTGNPLIIMAPTETTTYYARWENVCGISDCQSLLVTVVPAPELSAGGVDSVCEAAPYQVSNAWANNYTSVLWTTTGTGTFDDATLVNPLYTLGPEDVTSRDTVFLVMTVQGNSPCGPYTDSLLLVVNPLPEITFMPGDTAICRDSAVIIQAFGAYSYEWSPANGLSNTSGGAVVASPEASTEYTIIGTSSSGCVDSTKYNVRVLPTPRVDLGEDLYLFTCEPITLDAGKGDGSERYNWQDGSQRRYFRVEENGTYWVTVSNDGCMVTDTVKVQICEGYIWMPTAFTPNNDGLNETFQARTSDETVSFTMHIFSRSGALVFQTDDITKGWDGRDLNGELCPAGVYVWKIVYRGKGTYAPGIETTQSGVVTLVK